MQINRWIMRRLIAMRLVHDETDLADAKARKVIGRELWRVDEDLAKAFNACTLRFRRAV